MTRNTRPARKSSERASVRASAFRKLLYLISNPKNENIALNMFSNKKQKHVFITAIHISKIKKFIYFFSLPRHNPDPAPKIMGVDSYV